jgi:group I intron endonuclease
MATHNKLPHLSSCATESAHLRDPDVPAGLSGQTSPVQDRELLLSTLGGSTPLPELAQAAESRPSFVYIITHRASGKIYVGKTRYPERRWNEHKRGARLSHRSILCHALKKHGIENFDFTVIEEHTTEDAAYEAEAFFVEYLRWLGVELYNCNGGGRGSRDPTPETRAKIAATSKGRQSWCKGKSLSLETRAKIAASNRRRPGPNRGKKFSEEHRAKLSSFQKGKKRKPHSLEARTRMSEARRGQHCSEEHRAKLSASLKGRPLSDEHRQKIGAASRGRKHSDEAKAKNAATAKRQHARARFLKSHSEWITQMTSLLTEGSEL